MSGNAGLSVVIPWRSDGDPHRERALEWNLRRWRLLIPGTEVVVADSGAPEFHRGQSRNHGVAQATAATVILADADTTVPYQSAILPAVIMAMTRRWVLPYTVYYNVNRAETETILGSEPNAELAEPSEPEHRLTDSVAGVMVLPRDMYEKVGGYDERFVGWGYEDRAFALALGTLCGEGIRLPGYVLHLWHPVAPNGAFNSPMIGENRKLYERYRRAALDPKAMAAEVSHALI